MNLKIKETNLIRKKWKPNASPLQNSNSADTSSAKQGRLSTISLKTSIHVWPKQFVGSTTEKHQHYNLSILILLIWEVRGSSQFFSFHNWLLLVIPHLILNIPIGKKLSSLTELLLLHMFVMPPLMLIERCLKNIFFKSNKKKKTHQPKWAL